LAEARRSAHALRPLALEHQDLAGALAAMAGQLSVDQQTRVRFRLTGQARPLPVDVADHLLRIGQEAVTNALRHAQASQVDVELSLTQASLHLCVRDDGRGLPGPGGSPPQPRPDGMGLAGMQERAGHIGAQFAVTSQPGRGTRVEVTWQFPPDEPGKETR